MNIWNIGRTFGFFADLNWKKLVRSLNKFGLWLKSPNNLYKKIALAETGTDGITDNNFFCTT